MPIYEYMCKECDHEFEEFLSISSQNPKCPECGKETEKLVSRFSGVMKGSENRTIDCIVGEDADRRRGILEKRRLKRQQSQGE